jgi:hypothetical protein
MDYDHITDRERMTAKICRRGEVKTLIHALKALSPGRRAPE